MTDPSEEYHMRSSRTIDTLASTDTQDMFIYAGDSAAQVTSNRVLPSTPSAHGGPVDIFEMFAEITGWQQSISKELEMLKPVHDNVQTITHELELLREEVHRQFANHRARSEWGSFEDGNEDNEMGEDLSRPRVSSQGKRGRRSSLTMSSTSCLRHSNFNVFTETPTQFEGNQRQTSPDPELALSFEVEQLDASIEDMQNPVRPALLLRTSVDLDATEEADPGLHAVGIQPNDDGEDDRDRPCQDDESQTPMFRLRSSRISVSSRTTAGAEGAHGQGDPATDAIGRSPEPKPEPDSMAGFTGSLTSRTSVSTRGTRDSGPWNRLSVRLSRFVSMSGSGPDHWEGRGSEEGRNSQVEDQKDKSRRFQFHPDSFWRLMWNLASLLALIFDSIMIPFIIAWSPKSEGVILVGVWATALFWSMDVIINMRTSYFTKTGMLEVDQWRIAVRYLRSTMIVDVFLCTTDWIGIFLEAQKASAGGGDSDGIALIRVIKINRVFRIMRVLRVSTLWEKLEKFNRMFLSNTFQLMVQVTALFLFIIWYNHVLTCIWYIIGTVGSDSDTGYGWLDRHASVLDEVTMENSGMLYQYTTAFHWSVSQLTPGSMELVPMNSLERVYNIVMLLVGLLFCTSLISRLSALMVQLQISNQHTAAIVRKLHTFLRQQSVSASVAQRVEKQVTEQLSTVRPLCMDDLPVLSNLSKPLRTALKVDIFSKNLMQQPLFFALDCISPKATRALCDCLELRLIHAHEELFASDHMTRTSYLLLRGRMFYTLGERHRHLHDMPISLTASQMRSRGSDGASEPAVIEVADKYEWMIAAAFFGHWKTRGDMEAAEHSEVVCIDGRVALPAIVNSHFRVAALLRQYQKSFKELWKGMPEHERNKVTDLGEAVDHAVVVMCLPREWRRGLFEPLLDIIRRKLLWKQSLMPWRGENSITDLETELDEGKCALVSAKDGSVTRVAVVIALQVTRPGDELLLEVAEIQGSDCTLSVRFPATKCRDREAPAAAARRRMNELGADVRPALQSLELDGCAYVVKQCSTSVTYGLKTMYHRNIFDVSQRTSTPGRSPRLEPLPEAGSSPRCVSLSSIGFDRTSTRCSKQGTGDDQLEILKCYAPHLAPYFPDNVHIMHKLSKNKAVIYAWVHRDDVAKLEDYSMRTGS